MYNDRNPMPLPMMVRNLSMARSGAGRIICTLQQGSVVILRDLLGRVRNHYFSLDEGSYADLHRVMISGRWGQVGRTFTLTVTTPRGWEWCNTTLPAHCVTIEAAASVPVTV